MAFSGALVSPSLRPGENAACSGAHDAVAQRQTLTDLNDYITPSQACIKPVEQTNREEASSKPGAAAVRLRTMAPHHSQ